MEQHQVSLPKTFQGHDLVHSEYKMFRPQLRQISLHCERAKLGLPAPARQFSCTTTVAEGQDKPSGRYIQEKQALSKTNAVVQFRLKHSRHWEF
jgi:hypothetical protein